MPPKTKQKAVASDPKATPDPPPQTISERSLQNFYQTNPLSRRIQEVSLSGLTPAERKTYAHSQLIIPVIEDRVSLSHKAEREFWKTVAKEQIPIRRLRRDYDWGKDKSGRDLATYSIPEFEQRTLKQARLTSLDLLHRNFLTRREQGQITDQNIEEEKTRRNMMANLRKDLYGEQTDALARDPLWDDVIPIPQDEPEGALAKIAYTDNYAEAVSYLRAVMAAQELSHRALRLTEHVISMNPAHYTVWLYRFKILNHLDLSIPDEISWLNEVALENLKNYQIWHHRQLLMDAYYPKVSDDAVAVKTLAKSETDFISRILKEDTKNYHVWSYRQYFVSKLGLWTPAELGAAQNMIEDDVRNNSAWSHRFFVVFSSPKHSTTPPLPQTAHDPAVPTSIIDRELEYAREKIAIAPQNPSGWNYLRGVLAKGGRGFESEEEFAMRFVEGLGDGDNEKVTSSHALDLLADVFTQKGDVEKARLCLTRLAEKWDAVREGYWKYRIGELDKAKA